MSTYVNTGYYLKALADELVAHLHARLQELGHGAVRPSHGLIFQYMPAEGARITELAAKARITKQSMSVLFQQLEEMGYLARTPDPLDKRAVRFVLTEKGQEVSRLGRSINFEFEKRWETKLGVNAYQHFRQLLEKLYG
jgi:DNA-binding MarR family transcriptional regulator